MSFLSCRQQMGWAALIMGMSVLLSRFMGLFRDKVISFLFGATSESDIYFAAFVIPDFINYLLAGAYFSITLIPLLAAYFDESEEDGWRFFSTVFTWIALVITPLTVLAILLAPHLAHIAAPGLRGESMLRLVYFLRIIIPAQICFLLGSCLTAILYLRKQFFVPALTPLVYNFLIILGGILLRKRGMEGFCWGVLAGAFLGNLLLPYLAVKWGDGLHLYFSLRHEGLKKFFILALPLMLGQSIVVLDEQLVRIFGSLVGTGAISWLNYARRIMLVPVGVVAQAAGVASYPFLAELVAKDEHSRFYQTLRTALQSVMTLLIPLSIWMIVVAEPTIRLIFQQGHFSASDTLHTARLLQISLLAVFCWGIQQILGRAFYACQDTLTPAVLGTLATLVSIPIFYYLARTLDATGVALASVSSMVFYTALLSFWWWHRFGGETFSGLGKDQFKVLGFSLIAAVPSAIIVNYELIDGVIYPYWASLFEISVSGLCFACLFGLLSGYFAPSLVKPFLLRTGRLGAWLIR
ncbi:murein biosynthesis integral membrane protein MurJ [Desulforhabdus amnigena]|jgi:putative peptidoglycan lipid II flippase|uniref:Probable lipid II flippase MurJ n=1 Tax=Desulforhabdus amnigena TaxID=40218 RepID=A0A9W6CXM9_9BACT|nr:murein biosynthesis integral membrane protein MurJ [Desulforhabdus amnigena]NLJ29064.1 murein biosynthesis integral membrane protein MurJ [Deltaproteobacteria bacterium]GLI33721.1 lipid II flippase MurJ [Desulforhabdus amnigena]